MSNMRWTFIGAGNMAGSLVGGLCGSGVSGDNITVVDINQDACIRLADSFGVNTLDSVDKIELNQSVVIAVKPNVVETVCKTLADKQTNLAISVAAGVRSNDMETWLGNSAAIVRCMPNTPALLGLGTTALFANTNCSAEHRSLAETLLATAGKTCWVEKENDLDAVTAVSGSGPAYFFYLIEHMAKAGVALGLPADIAEDLAIETAFGAAGMARQRQHSPATLRENVTSKGGTTAAALSVFNDRNTQDIIEAAMRAAHDRAAELGDEFAASS